MKIESPLFALNDLQRTQAALDRSMQRLSSGQRINSASDDPAGLSIAAGLEAQVRGITMGIQNINESMGFLSTAEGAIATQTAITQRMRELAVNAATGTLSKTDRAYLNTEFQQLLSEFNRIAEQTNFNGTNLLDGTFTTSNIQTGATAQQVIPFTLSGTLSNLIFPTGSTNTTTSTTGTGTFQAPVFNHSSYNPYDVAFGDLNGDGKIDMLTADYSSGNQAVFLGNGDGTFKAANLFATASGLINVQLSDLNGDGKLDYVAIDNTNPWVYVAFGNGDGSFQAATTFTTDTGTQDIFLRDINGDGRKDIVVLGGNGIDVYFGNANGTFSAGVTTSFAAIPGGVNNRQMGLGDFNGDGKLDAAVVDGNNNRVLLFTGNGDGTFAAPTSLATGNSPSAIQFADFNGDGKLDIATDDMTDNDVSVFLGNGDGTFQARKTVGVGSQNLNAPPDFPLLATDLNGDGKADIVTADFNDKTISVLFGNGNGTFKARKTYSFPGSGTNSVRSADLNGDGVPDLITAVYGDPNDGPYVQIANTQTTTTTTGIYTPLDISTQTNASNVLSVLDSGLTNLNEVRSNIGAYQSRLESALSVNQITSENISSARSQIMDTDIASETSNLVKNQILLQAGVSVLAQANFQNQMILKLLNF